MKRRLKGLVERGIAPSLLHRSDTIEKIMLSSVGFPHQPAERQLDDLVAAAEAALKPLLAVALSGNAHATQHVAELTSGLCADLAMLASMYPEAANAAARQRTSWPMNVPAAPVERRRALQLITGPRRLPLGEREPRGRKLRQPSGFTTPATAAVLVALKAIEIERSFRTPTELFPTLQPAWSAAAARLPELNGTEAVAEQWFDVIWMYLSERHGGAPERSPLRRLVAPDPHSLTAPPESALRATLRETLRTAWITLAQHRVRRKRK